MLSHSLNEVVRKGAWTCVSCSKLSWICQVQAASPSRLLLARTHQRNHSSKPSSKSSNPSKDMPRALDATSKAPVNEVTPAMKPDSVNEVTPVMKPDNEKRPSTRTTRRKSGDITQEATGKTKDESLPSIPSVPSTQHLHPQDIHVASFFSIHRPISVTASVPPKSNPETFSSIFAPKASSKAQPQDVVYTISSTIDNFEGSATSSPRMQRSRQIKFEDNELHESISEAFSSNVEPIEIHTSDCVHPDSPHPYIQELVKSFRPFAPPPPPSVMGSVENMLHQSPSRQPATKQKLYSAILTILESTHPNGSKTYQTHTSPIREDPTPAMLEEAEIVEIAPQPHQPFLNHMRERQRRWEEFRDRNASSGAWYAISVKRQRKLKMKKHKYKKLMKRTKNLRRKLDRI